ncbi:flotillin [Roseivirga sp. 4D4]|uniref:flotillin family protein n=1 Tax=Roseivirga sp. 4D4 TaxID=1889784 RepID=UPI0008532800|nr:flotillin family protein [Roseivirga sp. 4D4]OEK03637.1 flotillin [Roseivirga sp. 4D4]
MEFTSTILAIGIGLLFLLVIILISRYKRCPSNKILVVYGKVGNDKSAKCIHGGGALVIPVIQDWQYLNLSPIPIEIDLKGALSKQNIRINTPSTFTVGISIKEEIMLNAAERLLGLSEDEVKMQALDIIIGQLRLVIATLSIEEINKDREQFLSLINKHVASELNKIGLELINVNIKDITDESGYIEAIGKKAAAEAINQAIVEVAQQESSGAMGQAKAFREKDVQVAVERAQSEEGVKEAEAKKRIAIANVETQAAVGEAKAQSQQEIQVAEQDALSDEGRKAAEAQKRVKIANLEAEAIAGENESSAKEAISVAELEERKAEAKRRSDVARAESLKAILEAEKIAELARLEKEEIIRNEINKRKQVIDAEAKAQETINLAKGEADSTLLKFQAEAKGMEELLNAKAAGYKEIIEACGGDSKAAATLLLLEQMETLVSRQTEALSNLKIDKITVWDSGSGSSGGDGTNATSGFIRNFISALPPVHDLAKQVGIDLPDYLGSMTANDVLASIQDKHGEAVEEADEVDEVDSDSETEEDA